MLDDPPGALIAAEVARAKGAGIAPGFAQKVAANAQGIADREAALGPGLDAAESRRLAQLLARGGTLAQLNEALAAGIRTGRITGRFMCPADALIDHLISVTLGKLAVDQPGYPGLTALRATDRAAHPPSAGARSP